MHTAFLIAKWSAVLIPALFLLMTATAAAARARALSAHDRQFGDFPSSPPGTSSRRVHPRARLVSYLRQALARATAGLCVGLILAEAGTFFFPGVL